MKFSIMDQTGHSEECFSESEVASAMQRFSALTSKGFSAAVRKPGEREYVLARSLPEETSSEVLFVPQFKGG